MKRILSIMMWACMAMAAHAAKVENMQINGVWYKLVSTFNTGEVISPVDGSKYTGTLNIPGEVEYNGITYEISAISEAAFKDCGELVAVTISDSITSIGNEAFINCTKLESVRIPAKVEDTGIASFKGCIGLKDVIIPVGVRYIGEETFYGCTNLKEVKLPHTIERIFTSAFENCTGLISVNLPDRVMEINHSVFKGCSSLSSVILPKVSVLSSYLFWGCSSLKFITFSNYVHTIGNGVFSGCTSLEEVHITDLSAWCKMGMTDEETSNPLRYARRLFLNGEEVKDLVIPEGITYVGGYGGSYSQCPSPFEYCSSIRSVTFSSTVTAINRRAFYGCENLKNIIIPETVTSYGETPFEESGIASITIPASVKTLAPRAFFNSEIPVTFIDTKTIESIGNEAFKEYEYLSTIDLPNCSYIGSRAFENCTNLASVTLPKESTSISIQNFTFAGCVNINDLCIPEGVKSIGEGAFKGCVRLGKIILPQSVTTIQDYAFEGCEQLAYVYIFAGNPPTTGWNIFGNCDIKYSILYVPEKSLENYKMAIYWEGFGKIVPLTDEEITHIPSIVNTALSVRSHNGIFVVDGASAGTPITVYTSTGVLAGFATAMEGSTTLYTQMQKGDAAIMKVGDKVMKIVMK